MASLDKYIIYTSVFAIFTESFFVHYGIDWKLFYLILISNSFVLGYKYSLKIHKNLLILLGFFLLHGLLMFLLFSNPLPSLLGQVLGIAVSSIFYYNLFRIYSFEPLVNVYKKIAFILALLAIPMFYFKINTFVFNRLNGILTEPAHYAAIMLPALYLFVRRGNYVKAGIILLTIFLTKSSVGFIALLFMLIIPLIKLKYFVRYSIIAIVILIVSGLYIGSKWNEKIDENKSNKIVRRLKQTQDSFNAVHTGKFNQDTNLSTYAFLSNLFITKEIVSKNPLGMGLGSYRHEYDKEYPKLSPPDYLVTLKQSKINRTDANSLLFRMLADLGIFGLLIFIYFLYRSIKIFGKDGKLAQQSSFFYLLTKLIREGHYFSPEFYFFVFLFLDGSDEHFTRS